MTTTLSATNHIRMDDIGCAFIDGTPFKVIRIALDKIAYGWSPEEIVLQHYNALTLAQVHAALAFYYDNQAHFDAEIEKRRNEYEGLRAKTLDSPGRQKLRAAPPSRIGGLHPGAFQPTTDFDAQLPDDFWAGQA